MKKFLSLVLALTMVMSLAACGSNGNTPAAGSGSQGNDTPADVITIKVGHQLSQSHPYQMALEYMNELLQERTNGRVQLQIFPSSQLGSERELLEGIQMGTVDMCLATGPVASFDPDFYINDLPYIYKNTAHAYAVLDGEIGQSLLDGLEAYQMKGITFWETGWLCPFNNVREVKTPDDLKGLSLRTMENLTYVNYFTELDCNPVPMAYSEFVSSVSNGTINGTLSPIVTIYTDKTYQICPYITRSYQWYCPAAMIMRPDLWNSFDAETQEIFMNCAKEARDYERQCLADLEQEYMDAIKADGGVITEVDVSLWQSSTNAIQAAWKEVVPSKVSQELIDQIVALGEQY